MRYPNLAAEMARRGVTQDDISRVIGKNRATVSGWVTGNRGDFSVESAMKMRDELFPGLNIEYLFGTDQMSA